MMKLTFVVLQDIVETLAAILLAEIRLAFSLLFEFLLDALPLVIPLNWLVVGSPGDETGRHVGFQKKTGTIVIATRWSDSTKPFIASDSVVLLWDLRQNRAVKCRFLLLVHGN